MFSLVLFVGSSTVWGVLSIAIYKAVDFHPFCRRVQTIAGAVSRFVLLSWAVVRVLLGWFRSEYGREAKLAGSDAGIASEKFQACSVLV
ncbi:unnamed protein product [Adineta ricciae]|uniref:Uncharacterized protein n=1 Tax=Adineta ricciae TaxID=249248 RepID=A0A815R0P7_ADIRI|nr:unnamed protein product [Adineta ricciae]